MSDDKNPTDSNSQELDIHSPDFVRDPYPVYRDLRHNCPVIHSNQYGGFKLYTRYADVREAALDWKNYTSSVPGVTAIPVITRRTEPQLPIELDPPLHSRYRALVNPVFASSPIESMRDAVRAIAIELAENLRAKGGGDLVSDYAVPLSVRTLALFTGLPAEDAPAWVEWINRMFQVADPEDGQKATAEFGEYIDRMIEDCRQAPGKDFVSRLIESEVDGQQLTAKEIHSFLTVVFGAGFETTADALSVMLYWLAVHPEERERLRENPDLIPTAVEEFVRWISPIQIFGRNATQDLEKHGCPVHKGEVVAVGFGSANRDETVFPEAESVDVARRPNRHLGFGAGPHSCLGAPVARLEMSVTLVEFLRVVPDYRLAQPEVLEWKGRGDRRGLSCCEIQIAGGG